MTTKRWMSGIAVTAAALVATAPIAGAEIAEDGAVVHVKTAAEHDKFVNETSKTMMVVTKFGAVWCPPCMQMKPHIEKMARESGGKWMLADVDADTPGTKSLMGPDKYNIQYLPTVMAHKNGSEVSSEDRVVGFPGKEALQEWINTQLAKN